MKMPWRDKTGLAKAATVLVMTLLLSLGLCGVNFFAVTGFVGIGGGNASGGPRQVLTSALTVAGVLELIGIFASLLGLVLVGMIAVVKSFGSGDPPPTITNGSE
jgi:hypothetical protein